jgi:hypothetical protein
MGQYVYVAVEEGDVQLFSVKTRFFQQAETQVNKLAFVQGSYEAPVSSVHHAVLATPTFTPFHTETVIRAIEV